MAAFKFQEMFELGPDTTEYRKLTSDHVSTVKFEGRDVLKVEPEALTLIAADISSRIGQLFKDGAGNFPGISNNTHRNWFGEAYAVGIDINLNNLCVVGPVINDAVTGQGRERVEAGA